MVNGYPDYNEDIKSIIIDISSISDDGRISLERGDLDQTAHRAVEKAASMAALRNRSTATVAMVSRVERTEWNESRSNGVNRPTPPLGSRGA